MKKVILVLAILLMVGCSKKPDVVCTEKSDVFKTNVELYFEGEKLTKATSVREYEEEALAKQVCATLGDKVKCYKNKVEVNDYLKSYLGNNKSEVIKILESQGLSCK